MTPVAMQQILGQKLTITRPREK